MTRKHSVPSGNHPAQSIPRPHSVAILEADALQKPLPDQPFAEGSRDDVDPDFRHRMISEAAYHLYVARGYADGNDIDDWLAAEAQIDHLLLRPDDTAANAGH